MTEFCNAPFYQLTLKPNGQATPCCYLYGLEVGKVSERGILDVWNSARMRALRREFLEGRVKTCRGRQQSLQCHKRFADLESNVEQKEVLSYAPRRLDLRLNGTCNLSCVMCEVWQEPAGLYQGAFWKELSDKVIPGLQSCDILGGEPFVQSDTFRLIDEITAVNSACSFAFVTNGHYPYTQRIDRYLRHIPLRYIQVSIDSLRHETYESIRHGSLALVLRTVEKLITLRNERREFELIFSMCVLRNNWREIPEFLKFCQASGARPEFQYAHYDVSQKHSLKFADETELTKLLNLLKKTSGDSNVLAALQRDVEREASRRSAPKLSSSVAPSVSR